jgi:hypothetical protein
VLWGVGRKDDGAGHAQALGGNGDAEPVIAATTKNISFYEHK